MERGLLEDVQDKYVVVTETKALVPVFDIEIRTMIYETNRRIIFSRQTPLEIMKAACLDGGASMNGRIDYVRDIIGIYQRRPIPVNETEGIYAFPLLSQKDPANCWIFYSHVRKGLTDKNTGEGIVLFFDGQQLPVTVSSHRLKQQIFKTSHCKSVCESRVNRRLQYKNT
ncbi:hypothetical protein D7Z54_28480 [Salibacterium salarium]|uniref:Competence protein ComK n=1 Tax=Salibacterium salarium TaxID=284579 RepID=A0A3R9P466_9BACI|nr:competence protein ComK [Salibacterium salarium]RSL29961.1 hypothetical protein D7Z54_28480 [Salibacterium salarium]